MRVAFLALLFSLSLGSGTLAAEDGLEGILGELQDVEVEMAANQDRITALKDRILELQTLGKNADLEIAKLQSLVEEHAARVEQLADRYTKVLALAQKLKRDLEFSTTLNYVLGAGALVATSVAVLVAVAK